MRNTVILPMNSLNKTETGIFILWMYSEMEILRNGMELPLYFELAQFQCIKFSIKQSLKIYVPYIDNNTSVKHVHC